MNLTVQRFAPGNTNYSDARDIKGLQAIFGQMLDATGKFICWTLERRDTLTPEGCYPFAFYASDVNKMIVPLLSNVAGFTGIEIHIANWPHDLKGCTAVGLRISPGSPAVNQSTDAFNALVSYLLGKPFISRDALGNAINQDMLTPLIGQPIGTITYETLTNT